MGKHELLLILQGSFYIAIYSLERPGWIKGEWGESEHTRLPLWYASAQGRRAVHGEAQYVVRAMRKVDPSIILIAVGAMPDEMTIDEIPLIIDPHTHYVVGRTVVEYGSPADWTYRLIKECMATSTSFRNIAMVMRTGFDILAGRTLSESVQDRR